MSSAIERWYAACTESTAGNLCSGPFMFSEVGNMQSCRLLAPYGAYSGRVHVAELRETASCTATNRARSSAVRSGYGACSLYVMIAPWTGKGYAMYRSAVSEDAIARRCAKVTCGKLKGPCDQVLQASACRTNLRRYVCI